MISGSTGSGPAGPVRSIWSRWCDCFGETHLTLDAVVAHVDGELAPGPAQRAAEHAARCLLCAGEVAEQRRTRGRLRAADTPGAPSALLSALRAIPDETAPPTPPAGGAGGETDAAPRDDTASGGEGPPRGRRGESRGVRRGLPVTVASGIALGAVALPGVPGVPGTPVATRVARSVGTGPAAPDR